MTPNMARKNKRLMAGCFLTVGLMIGLSFAAVPIYNLFCRVTGYAGTTQVSTVAPDTVHERVITIRFDASTNVDLPWSFQPVQHSLDLNVGDTALAFYTAKSNAATRTVGTSTFNVTPLKAGQYFDKIECFCFTEQVLEAGQQAELPVSFYIDPEILEDHNLDDVDTITLSYTFFLLEDDDSDTDTTAAVSKPQPVN